MNDKQKLPEMFGSLRAGFLLLTRRSSSSVVGKENQYFKTPTTPGIDQCTGTDKKVEENFNVFMILVKIQNSKF